MPATMVASPVVPSVVVAPATRPSLITVIGSLNMDLVSYVDHHPAPGETMTASSFALSPGGKGANQAVACTKLSRRRPAAGRADDDDDGGGDPDSTTVRMVGAVGADAYGAALTASLRAYGADTTGVAVRAGARTGVAVVLVDERTGQNRIALSPESNGSLQPAQFAALPPPWPDLLLLQLEIPLPTVLQIQRAARAARVPVLLNPAPAVPLPPAAYDGLAHLVVNETEAAVLAGVDVGVGVGDDDDGDGDDEDDAALHAAAAVFLGRGVHTVLITLGGRGVFYASSAGAAAAAEKTTVVDTTAAGDTFVDCYALEVVRARARGQPLDLAAAVRKANRAAVKTVAKMGAQDSIPWQDEL